MNKLTGLILASTLATGLACSSAEKKIAQVEKDASSEKELSDALHTISKVKARLLKALEVESEGFKLEPSGVMSAVKCVADESEWRAHDEATVAAREIMHRNSTVGPIESFDNSSEKK